MQQSRLINNSSQLNMFREIILPIFRSTRLCVTACGVMHSPRCCRPKAGNIVGSALVRKYIVNLSIYNNLNTILTITNMATMRNRKFISDKYIVHRIGHNKLITNIQENKIIIVFKKTGLCKTESLYTIKECFQNSSKFHVMYTA